MFSNLKIGVINIPKRSGGVIMKTIFLNFFSSGRVMATTRGESALLIACVNKKEHAQGKKGAPAPIGDSGD